MLQLDKVKVKDRPVFLGSKEGPAPSKHQAEAAAEGPHPNPTPELLVTTWPSWLDVVTCGLFHWVPLPAAIHPSTGRHEHASAQAKLPTSAFGGPKALKEDSKTEPREVTEVKLILFVIHRAFIFSTKSANAKEEMLYLRSRRSKGAQT